MSISLRQLRYLVAVADHQSFRKAATAAAPVASVTVMTAHGPSRPFLDRHISLFANDLQLRSRNR